MPAELVITCAVIGAVGGTLGIATTVLNFVGRFRVWRRERGERHAAWSGIL